VHGDVEHDAAACLGLADAPALQVLGQAHGVEHASEERRADRTVADEPSDRLVRRGIAQVVVGAQHDTGLPACLDDGLRVCHVHRQRLLAQHMLARGGRGNRLWRVQLVGGADVDGIDSRIGEQIVDRRPGLRDSLLSRERRAALRVAAHHRNDLVARLGTDCADHPFARNRARADQSPAQLVCHRRPPSVLAGLAVMRSPCSEARLAATGLCR
jgi:hypothetical protein